MAYLYSRHFEKGSARGIHDFVTQCRAPPMDARLTWSLLPGPKGEGRPLLPKHKGGGCWLARS